MKRANRSLTKPSCGAEIDFYFRGLHGDKLVLAVCILATHACLSTALLRTEST
jgi:hypothetical protein